MGKVVVNKEELEPLVLVAAEYAADEKLARHENLRSERERIVQANKEQLSNELVSHIEEIMNDFQVVSEVLSSKIEYLSKVEKDAIEKEFQRAVQNFQSETFFQSQKDTLQEAMQLSPDFLRRVYNWALELQKEKHLDQAKALFRYLCALNPYLADFWIGLGFVYVQLKQFHEADASFEQAQEVDPENPRLLFFLSLSAHFQKDSSKLLPLIEQGLKLAEANPDEEKKWKDLFLQLKESSKHLGHILKNSLNE